MDSNNGGRWGGVSRRKYGITRRMRAGHLDECSGIAQVSLSQRAGAPGRLYLCRAMNAYTEGPSQRIGGMLAKRPSHASFGSTRSKASQAANPLSHAPSGVRTCISLSRSMRGKGACAATAGSLESRNRSRERESYGAIFSCVHRQNEQEPSMKMSYVSFSITGVLILHFNLNVLTVGKLRKTKPRLRTGPSGEL